MNDFNAKTLGYVVVTDYIEANTGADVSDALQKIIDENPHRTVYFPDGEYVLAKPICTPANPATAVSIHLSDFATLRASDDWSDTEAMVRLGAAEPYNNIHMSGSNFLFTGGIVDGNKRATGIAIEGGRETLITRVSIKHTQVGIHIKRMGNGNSSDADIEQVNITGNNMPDSVGVLIEGFDNTLHNMRIAAVQTGILLLGSAGNSMRDIHPLFIYGGEMHAKRPDMYDDKDYIDYSKSVAFDDQGWGPNWYSYCYNDQMATGFKFKGGNTPVFEHCFAMWYSPRGNKEIAFDCDGKFCATINSALVSLRGDVDNTAFLKVGEEGGLGVVNNPIFDPNNCKDDTYKDYLLGRVIYNK